jgi:GH35 family endo-1,4-beta-xylanase
MKPFRISAIAAFSLLLADAISGGTQQASANDLPRLVRAHGAMQLIVDGRPTLLRAGELENSSASSADFMTTIWPKLTAMHLNAVLAPVYWELIEPKEGGFDFHSVDTLIADARQHGLRLVRRHAGDGRLLRVGSGAE